MSWVAIGTLREELEEGPFEVPHPASSKAEAMINVAPAMSSFPMGILFKALHDSTSRGSKRTRPRAIFSESSFEGSERCSRLGSSSLRMPRRGPGASVSVKDRPIVAARIPILGLDQLWPAHGRANRNLVYFDDHEQISYEG